MPNRLEAREYVSTGVISYAEGDLIEVELTEFKYFQLKENVKVTVYSPVGILVFFSTIIAKSDGSVVIMNVPDVGQRFGEVRQYPRVKVTALGTVERIDALGEEIGLTTDNISLGGAGFKVFDDTILNGQCKIQLNLTDDVLVRCLVEIVRTEQKDNYMYYGAKFLDMNNRMANALRAFIMSRQMELYFAHKKTGNKL